MYAVAVIVGIYCFVIFELIFICNKVEFHVTVVMNIAENS
jgi:hypothetical protein